MINLIKRNVMFLFLVIFVEVAYSQTENSGLNDTNEYIIKLEDNPLFGCAFYADAYSSNITRLVSGAIPPFLGRLHKKKSKDMYKDTYNIFSYDGKYIYKGILKKDSDTLYTKYNPRQEDDNEASTMKMKSRKELHYWMGRELKERLIISIVFEKRQYICKSFKS